MGDFVAGLDLGQAHDYSALVIVEEIDHPTYNPANIRIITEQGGPRWGALGGGGYVDPRPISRRVLLLEDGSYGDVPPDDERSYDVRHIHRWKLGTPYPTIVNDVVTMMSREPLKSRCNLVIDATGVGRPVVDMFNHHPGRDFSFSRVLITGGDTASNVDGYWHTPKRDLVGAVQVLLQTRRLRFPEASKVPEVATLMSELATFQTKINLATAHDSYGAWREGQHDDLTLALAMAVWFAERGQIRVYGWG